MASSIFRPPSDFTSTEPYHLLPFRFAPFDEHRYLLTTDVGEYALLPREDLVAFVERSLPHDGAAYRALKARHFLYDETSRSVLDLLALQYRSRLEPLAAFTGLHIFVVTLRCDQAVGSINEPKLG